MAPKKKASSKTKKAKPKAVKAKPKVLGYYCGISNPPKGKVRGSVEYCVNHNQVRYYGIEAVKKKDLIKTSKTPSIDKERIKLQKIGLDIDDLVKAFAKVKRVLDDPKSTRAQLKSANKKKEALLKKKEVIRKKYQTQRNYVLQLADEEKKLEKEKKKQKAKKKS